MASTSTDCFSDVKNLRITNYRCVVCSSLFSFRKSLYAHLKKVHGYDQGNISTCGAKYKACELCKMVFSDIKEHKQVVHGITVEDRKNSQQLCSICGVMVSNGVLKKHQERMHSNIEQECEVSVKESYSRTHNSRMRCPECNIHNLKTYIQLQNHLTVEHDIKIEYEMLRFNSFEEFEEWKREYEDTHFVLYTKDSSSKPSKSSPRRIFYYNCHRSHTFRPSVKPSRLRKLMGSNKIGSTCPSHIKVAVGNDTCVVYFWKTHVGHAAEVMRCKLRKDVRAEIAWKMKQGIPVQSILEETRNSLVKNKVLHRVHLLTKKDIHNISRDYRIQFNQGGDNADLADWVKRMHQQSESSIIYFKNKGDMSLTFLTEDDFVLILIVPSQIPQLKKFGSQVICVDRIQYQSTFNCNVYILLTVDVEIGSACAVAFCFSNKSDEAILKLFFEEIKNCVQKIKTSVFMSDINSATYKSWSLVMSEVPCHFWLKWHVLRDWREQIETLVSSKKCQGWVYKELQTIQTAIDVKTFKTMFSELLNNFDLDPDVATFNTYFRNYYAACTELWWPCFRQNLQSMFIAPVEALHKVYERYYSRILKLKSFVVVIETILEIARDHYFQHIIKTSSVPVNSESASALIHKENIKEEDNNLEQTTNELAKGSSINKSLHNDSLIHLSNQTLNNQLKHINDCHINSKAITREMVVTVKNDIEWSVKVSRKKVVDVVRLNVFCTGCTIRCHKCNICVHEFQCSCTDYVTNFNICIHIHACVSLCNKSRQNDNIQLPAVNLCDSVMQKDFDILNNCKSEVFEIMYVQDVENNSKKLFFNELKHKTDLLLNLSQQTSLNENDQISILSEMDKMINIFTEKQ